MHLAGTLARALAGTSTAAASLEVDFDSLASIEAATAAKAQDVIAFYHGNEVGNTPGILHAPYFWWQAGALWGTIIDYWKYTTDTQYNDMTRQALLFQVGPHQDYLPPNVTASIGNDDQGFWAMSTMLAAETGFQDPTPSEPQWLSLVHAVYNTQKRLLDQETACGGGLRWQVLVYNNGYNYKNSITNAVFFNIAARLAHYTGRNTYANSAKSIYRWLKDVGLIDKEYNVWDGAHIEHNCTDINHKQTSYLPAVLLQGAAFMWKSTQDKYWKTEVNRLLASLLADFFPNGVLFEPACDGSPQPSLTECTPDMRFYKGFVLRWMADTAVLCPWTKATIGAVIRSSAKAAVATCTGGASGRLCGMNWQRRAHDGDTGVGQEMNVLSALMTLMAFRDVPGTHEDDGEVLENADEDAHDGFEEGAGRGLAPPLTRDSGGTSVGDEDAGKESRKFSHRVLRPIQKTDRVGASFATALLLTVVWAMFAWICVDDDRPDARTRMRRPGELEDLEKQVVVKGVEFEIMAHTAKQKRYAEGARGDQQRHSSPRAAERHGHRRHSESARPSNNRGHQSRNVRKQAPAPLQQNPHVQNAEYRGRATGIKRDSHTGPGHRRYSHSARPRDAQVQQQSRDMRMQVPATTKATSRTYARGAADQGQASGARAYRHAASGARKHSQAEQRSSTRLDPPRAARGNMSSPTQIRSARVDARRGARLQKKPGSSARNARGRQDIARTAVDASSSHVGEHPPRVRLDLLE